MKKRILAIAVASTGLALYARLNSSPRTSPLPDAQATAPREATGSLNVLSLNLGHGRGQAASQWRVDADGHRAALAAVADLIRREDPDLIALQEVDGPSWWSGRFDHLQNLQDALDGPAAIHGVHANALGLQYGTALIGRDQLTDATSHTFGASGFTPRKGFVIARTRLDGRPLDVVSLHLDFALPNVRDAQLNELAQVLRRRGGPVVLVGDFNMEPSILSSFVTEHGLSTLPVDVTFPTTGGRIDHVLVSQELTLTTLQVLPDFVSDHRAVRASIRWRE